MQYYLINKELAERLGLTQFRHGCNSGFVVTSGDLVTYGISEAIAEEEAKHYIKNINKR